VNGLAYFADSAMFTAATQAGMAVARAFAEQFDTILKWRGKPNRAGCVAVVGALIKEARVRWLDAIERDGATNEDMVMLAAIAKAPSWCIQDEQRARVAAMMATQVTAPGSVTSSVVCDFLQFEWLETEPVPLAPRLATSIWKHWLVPVVAISAIVVAVITLWR
jgi:hypothetical protein